MKITDDCMPFTNEINTMRKIKSDKSPRAKSDSTPVVIDYGLINHEIEGEATMKAYLIMPRYGNNLEAWFEKIEFKLNRATILDLGQRLLTVFREIHSAGYAYNDLKLDNLMIGHGQKMRKLKSSDESSALEGASLHLVDFGYASKFMKNKKHIKLEEQKSFKGNMMFSSLN